MKFTINTDILSKNNLTLGEFLILLIGYHNIEYETCYQKLLNAKVIEPNLFNNMGVVLSNNMKDKIAQILMESDEKVMQSTVDFEALAGKLQDYYPEGNKTGTTYPWKGDCKEIAMKLRILVVKYDFTFTEEEAIQATKQYVDSFTKPYTYMHLLRNFILNTKRDYDGEAETGSEFMTLIENNRK